MGAHLSPREELKHRAQTRRDESLQKFDDIDSARSWLQNFRPDSLAMHRLREVLCEVMHDAARLTDNEVLDLCAWQMANGNILLKSHGPAAPAPLGTKPVGKEKISLQRACDEAFKRAFDCSHAVWDVLKAMVNPDEPYKAANELIDALDSRVKPTNAIWRLVDIEQAFSMANADIVVVAGAKDSPNGHVVIIYPGDKKSDGGFRYRHKDSKTGASKLVDMRSTGSYPRCMSRSNGDWPGATSNGDRTVRDPWSKEMFQQVRYWAYVDKPLP